MSARLPRDKARITGADIRNPSRYRCNSPSRTPIGDPSFHLTSAQRQAWDRFKAELPWLMASHRALLELACLLRARIESETDVGVNHLQVFSAILSKLGATPVDEARIGWSDDVEEIDDLFDA